MIKNDPCGLDLDLSGSTFKKQKLAPPTVTHAKFQAPTCNTLAVANDIGVGKKKEKKRKKGKKTKNPLLI